MPLPLLVIAAGAAIGGVVAGAKGAAKMKEANDTIKTAQGRHERNMNRFEEENERTAKEMDKLGKREMQILKSFGKFSDLFERIQNRPDFKAYTKNNIKLSGYKGEQLKKASVGASVLLGGLEGAVLGTAGAYAAGGATTAAVFAFGTASTGTAISSLSGAALTNATLAALGGGSLAAGGGGIALGTTVLGVSTLGVGLLVGGIIFNFTGGKLSEKADEIESQVDQEEKKINEIIPYLKNLREISAKFYRILSVVDTLYWKRVLKLIYTVDVQGRTDWNSYTCEEQKEIENTVLLVGLLYKMCQTEFVIKSKNENEINVINKAAIRGTIESAETLLKDKFEGKYLLN